MHHLVTTDNKYWSLLRLTTAFNTFQHEWAFRLFAASKKVWCPPSSTPRTAVDALTASHDNPCATKWLLYLLKGSHTNRHAMTLLFHYETLNPQTEVRAQTKPLCEHFAFPKRVCSRLQEEALFRERKYPKKNITSLLSKKTLCSYLLVLCRGVHMSWCLFWSVIVGFVIMVGTVMCLPAPCYYDWVEDCAVLCATSGLLRRANERSV